jgi:broad specificity phosphatase PhoE
MWLTLVRHGRTAWNAAGLAQGHTDIGLDADGLIQSEALARRLADHPFQAALSSDLERCRQTLAPVLAARPVPTEFRTDLRERTFGDMEGVDYGALNVWIQAETARTGRPAWAVRPPGGESAEDLWRRLEAVESALRAADRDTLVVSHGGALAQLLSRLLRGTVETSRSFRFQNCSVTVLLRRPDGGFVLEEFNDTRHLGSAVESAGLAR